jgi:hypothetical protein
MPQSTCHRATPTKLACGERKARISHGSGALRNGHPRTGLASSQAHKISAAVIWPYIIRPLASRASKHSRVAQAACHNSAGPSGPAPSRISADCCCGAGVVVLRFSRIPLCPSAPQNLPKLSSRDLTERRQAIFGLRRLDAALARRAAPAWWWPARDLTERRQAIFGLRRLDAALARRAAPAWWWPAKAVSSHSSPKRLRRGMPPAHAGACSSPSPAAPAPTLTAADGATVSEDR